MSKPATRSYQQIVVQYDGARIQAGFHSANLVIADPALPASGPSSPRKVLNAGIATMVTLMGGVVVLAPVEFVGALGLKAQGRSLR